LYFEIYVLAIIDGFTVTVCSEYGK